MYLVIFVILFLGSYIRPKHCYIRLNKKNDITEVYLFAICAVLMLISAFRVNTGRDYGTYTSALVGVKNGRSLSWLNFEPGFILLYKLLAPFTRNGQIAIIASSVITIALVFAAIKKYSDNVCQSIFLFYALYLYCMSFNLVRQFIAIGIIHVSIKYFAHQKTLKALICILIASMFHSTALLCIPFYFFQKLRMSKKMIFTVAAVAIVVFAFYNQLIRLIVFVLPKYERYLRADGSSSIFNIIILTLNLLMLVYVKDKRLYKNSEADMLNFYLAAALFGLVVTAFTVKIVYFARASYYFFAVSIYSIPFCWSKLKGRIEYYCAKGSVIAATSMLFIHLLNANSGTVVPYQLWDFKGL